MFPILFSIGPITLHTYGLMVALGFLAAVVWCVRRSRAYGLDPATVQDMCVYMALAGLIGSRLWFIGLAWPHFRDHPLDALKFWQGGLVFYGGLILAMITAIAVARLRRVRLFDFGDLAAPGLALGQAIGRLGCLSAGCCYGRPADLPWAVTFSHPECLAPLNRPLHPTQLYWFLSLLLLFGFLAVLGRRRRFSGQIFWTYGLVHGLLRAGLEVFRGDFRGPALFPGLTSTQLASLSLAAVSLAMLAVLRARAGRQGPRRV